MSLKSKIGKRFEHDSLGKVEIVGVEENSRTKVLVKILERGEGYDESTNKYKGVRTKSGWFRGENKQYGTIDVVHIKTLKTDNHG